MSLGKLSVRALLDLSVLFLYRASQGIYLPDCLCRLACLFQLISYPSVASIWGAPGICTSSTSSTQLQPASNYLISDRPSAASFSSLPVRLSPAIHPPVSMYSIKNSGWKLMHVMCIFVHLGLTVTAAVSHLYNLGKEDRLLVGGSPVYWNYLTATNGEPCHGLVLMGRSGPESWVTSNAITQTLLITCIAVVSPFPIPYTRPIMLKGLTNTPPLPLWLSCRVSLDSSSISLSLRYSSR